MGARRQGPYVVLDDDPTGVQTLAGIRVLLAWDTERVRAALRDRPAVHLITNTRALAPEHVQRAIEQTTRAALAAAPDGRIILRGDSTLRGHLLEEYLGVRHVLGGQAWPVLLLVPALPSAGRVTVGGVQFLERNGARIPLHATEYAEDGVFAYHSARLLEWAEERSDGLFRASAGSELPLAALRSGGSAAVADALMALIVTGEPAAFVPDAETDADLGLVAAGFDAAVERGVGMIVRCAPAFAGVLAGTTSTEVAPLPAQGDGVLVVCGSYVAQTTRQLSRLLDVHPASLAEADVVALAARDASFEIGRLAIESSRRLAEDGLAILATPRERPVQTVSLEAGGRIALNLARAVAQVNPRPSVVVAKGGITAAVTLLHGIGANEAEVCGPVEPGVSRWVACWPDGDPLDYLVVPGNVGDDDLLARLVGSIMGGTAAC